MKDFKVVVIIIAVLSGLYGIAALIRHLVVG